MGDIALTDVGVGDSLIVFPHETCPVDGSVLEGSSSMNEAYLTGEPYLLPKTTGRRYFRGPSTAKGP